MDIQGNVTIRSGIGAEPIHLDEAKAQCRIDITDEDALVSALITAARVHVESATNRAMMTQAMRVNYSAWPCRADLSAPTRRVASVTYLDAAAAAQTLATDQYVVDTTPLQGSVTPAYSVTWPDTYEHPNAVSVNFIAGHATPFTVNTTTDTLTAKGHPFANNDPVRLMNSGGALPAGTSDYLDYYAVSVSGDTLKLSLTEGGAAVDITSAGTGTHFILGSDTSAFSAMRQAMLLLIGHWFDNRSQSTGFQTHNIPMGVSAILAPHKVWGV
jgi:uncharacterized phiE125 gp8 family phage protein